MANAIDIAPDVVGLMVPQTVLPIALTETGGKHYQELLSGALTLRYDEGATYTYVGEATPGADEGDAVWRIKRITNASNTILWADGNSAFDNIWTAKGGLVYL